jgi:hypothetical protein
MKLTIIPVDGSVGEDKKFYNDLDLNSCNIPANVHALQWNGATGWIEFNTDAEGNTPTNQNITSLPDWAVTCEQEWQTADYAAKNPPPIIEQRSS